MKNLGDYNKLTPDKDTSYYNNVYCAICGKLTLTKRYFYQPGNYTLTSSTCLCDECVKEHTFPNSDPLFHETNIREDESVFQY